MGSEAFQLLSVKRAGALVVRAASGHVFPRHFHDEYGMGFIEAGAQRSASGRGQVEAGQGDVIASNPGEIHDGEPIGGASRRWCMIFLRPASVAEAWQQVQDTPCGEFQFLHPARVDQVAAGLLARLFRTFLASDPMDQLKYEELVLSLLSRLGTARVAELRHAPDRVARAKALIDGDPAQGVSLADLAAESGLSRFQILRAFTRSTGFTPHGYLVQRRLLLARSLLMRGEPLAQAASASGFCDQSHMSRSFVQAYGYAPGRLARAVRSS